MIASLTAAAVLMRSSFFCPNPGCSVQIELVRGWSMEGLKLQCSGHGLTKHEPTEMVCTCVDGDARPLTSSFS